MGPWLPGMVSNLDFRVQSATFYQLHHPGMSGSDGYTTPAVADLARSSVPLISGSVCIGLAVTVWAEHPKVLEAMVVLNGGVGDGEAARALDEAMALVVESLDLGPIVADSSTYSYYSEHMFVCCFQDVTAA